MFGPWVNSFPLMFCIAFELTHCRTILIPETNVSLSIFLERKLYLIIGGLVLHDDAI